MPQFPALFLDDGGVMNDNARRAPQWRRLLGEFMPQHLGRTPEEWAEANRVQFPQLWASLVPRMAEFGSYEAFQREYDLRWLEMMCNYLGLETPNEERSRELATEAARYIAARLETAYPDAAPAIRALRVAGFELHTASGTRSWELDAYLRTMGVRDCFGHLFGPDLVDVMKGSAEYYRRIFARASIDPASAIVFDDSPQACAWAKEAGAEALHIDRESPHGRFGGLAAASEELLSRYA